MRAFRVYEGDGLAHRNGEFVRREYEIGEVDGGVSLALGMGIYESHAHENGEGGLNQSIHVRSQFITTAAML